MPIGRLYIPEDTREPATNLTMDLFASGGLAEIIPLDTVYIDQLRHFWTLDGNRVQALLRPSDDTFTDGPSFPAPSSRRDRPPSDAPPADSA